MALSFPMHNLCSNGVTHSTNTLSLSTRQEVLKELYSEEYGPQILSRFNEFRQDGLFCDFSLTVEDEEFTVHKMVLAGCSDYFRALFSHGMRDSNVDSFELTEVSLKGFKPLLEFAYTGKLKLNIHVLPEILEVATFLQMRPAINLCQVYLNAIMNLEDSDDIVSLAMNFGLTELKEAQKRLILENFLDFSKTKKFLQLDYKTLMNYLKDDSLCTTTEGKLLKCVLLWYNHDPLSREEHIHEVLDKIRYVQDGWPTIDFASAQEPFISNKKCKDILRFSKHYMQQANQKHLVYDYRTKVRYDSHTLMQVGGIVNYQQEMVLEYPFLDELMLVRNDAHDKVAWGRNHYYHSKLKTWLPTGVIGTSDMRSHCPVVEVNGHGVLVGGYLYTSDLTTIYQHCSCEVKLINPGLFSLWDLSYMNDSRALHAACATKNFVYAIGGKNESGPLRSVEQYYIEKDMWGNVTGLPSARYNHAATSVGESVFISGGIVEDVITNSVLAYQPDSGEWLEKPSMLSRRSEHTMVRLDDQLVVCGGHTLVDSSRCLNSVEVFSLELHQWTYITPMRKDCAGMAAVVLNGRLVVLGGEDSVGDLLGVVQQYNTEEKRWTNHCDLVAPLRNAGVCALTIKLTENGERDRDSLADEYDQRLHLPSDDEDEYQSDESFEGIMV